MNSMSPVEIAEELVDYAVQAGLSLQAALSAVERHASELWELELEGRR